MLFLLLKGDFRPCNAREARKVRADAPVSMLPFRPERCGSAPRSSGKAREFGMVDQGKSTAPEESERGKRAGFDPDSGEVHGSGSGAGGNGSSSEDYDNDPIAGGGEDQAAGPRTADRGIRGRTDADEGI
jgi:hypothetical protein